MSIGIFHFKNIKGNYFPTIIKWNPTQKISRERHLPGFPDFSRYVVGTNKTRKRLSNLIQDKQGNNKVLDRICNSFCLYLNAWPDWSNMGPWWNVTQHARAGMQARRAAATWWCPSCTLEQEISAINWSIWKQGDGFNSVVIDSKSV